jgi:hypothetical protein
MPNGRHSNATREQVCLLLANGFRVKRVAEKTEVPVRTIGAWQQEEQFRARMTELREQSMTTVLGRLSRYGAGAVRTLWKISQDATQRGSVRVAAATALLVHQHRGIELHDLADKVAELERRQAKDKHK